MYKNNLNRTQGITNICSHESLCCLPDIAGMAFLKNYYSFKNMSLALLLLLFSFIIFFPLSSELVFVTLVVVFFFNFLPSKCFFRHPVLKAGSFTATKLCCKALVLSSFRSHCCALVVIIRLFTREVMPRIWIIKVHIICIWMFLFVFLSRDQCSCIPASVRFPLFNVIFLLKNVYKMPFIFNGF